MFTGIIEETGRVQARQQGHLTLEAPLVAADIAVGDSLAVDGCCLTLTGREGGRLRFDLLGETLDRTNLGDRQPGDRVNLERALAVGGRLGGHFVQGHVDATGRVLEFSERGADRRLVVEMPREQARYAVMKGSIAINGVSLTIAELTAESLGVWLIPHTLAGTNLGDFQPGTRVNLEFDLLAKHTERLLAER